MRRMANKYCNLDGSKKIKDEYMKINVGFDLVETDVNNLDTKIDNVNSKVNTIITTPADSVSAQEIIDARGGRPVLGERFEDIETDIADFTKFKSKLPIATGEYIATKTDARIINIGFIPALLIIYQYVGSGNSRQHIGHFWYTSGNVYYYAGMTHTRDGTSSIHNDSDVTTELLGRIEDGKIGFSFLATGEGDRIIYFAFGDVREVIK